MKEFKLKNFISKMFSFLLISLSILVIIFSLYYIVQIKFKNKILVNFFGYTILEVKSGSMEKELLVSDIILIKLIEGENKKEKIKVDDIITFRQENHLVTHRVLELNEDDLITKGDANNVADKPIVYPSIEGRYIKTLINKNILKQVVLEKKVFIPLSIGGLLLIIALIIDTEEDYENKSEKDVYEKKRKKIQKGKRFKN